MALFQITRSLSGWTDDEIEAGALRAETCVGSFEGLRWVRSFFDPEREVSYCIYESPDAQSIRDHATTSDIPCEEVREVREYLPIESEPRRGR